MEKEIKKMLSIHLTDLCNNKCIFCIVDSPGKNKNAVFKETVFKFLEDNKNNGYTAVNLHGGEATTRTDFFEILEKIKDCGYPNIILQTNARKFSKSDFATKAISYNINKVVVSIHGSKSEIHDRITQIPNSLKHAVKGIENIKELGVHVRTNSVMSELNYKDFPNIIKLLLCLKVDHINISAIHTAGAAYKNFDTVTPTYINIFPYLKESVSEVIANKTTLTLEGFPYCMIPEMEKYVIDWESQKFKMLFRDKILEDYETYMDKSMRVQGPPCLGCIQKDVCGGVYKEYIEKRGWQEFGYKQKQGSL